ncbi:hypothetical protein ABBQ32_004011 [Trebouxia sp. C0010 RCD-2024]
MKISDKTIWLKELQISKGTFCKMDVTLLQTSKDSTEFGSSSVKINPFDDRKGEYIKESFNVGKLDWATVVIVTDPASTQWEGHAAEKIAAFDADPTGLSRALQSIVKEARKAKTTMDFVCLAGNHSVWAAQQLLKEGGTAVKIEEFREAFVFKNSDLSEDSKLILAAGDNAYEKMAYAVDNRTGRALQSALTQCQIVFSKFGKPKPDKFGSGKHSTAYEEMASKLKDIFYVQNLSPFDHPLPPPDETAEETKAKRAKLIKDKRVQFSKWEKIATLGDNLGLVMEACMKPKGQE